MLVSQIERGVEQVLSVCIEKTSHERTGGKSCSESLWELTAGAEKCPWYHISYTEHSSAGLRPAEQSEA